MTALKLPRALQLTFRSTRETIGFGVPIRNLFMSTEYRRDFPETPEPAPQDPEACEPQSTLDVGLTWAALELAKGSEIRAHLQEVFGKEAGEDLLYLAIYKLAGGGAMMTYNIWRQKVWLPQSRRLTGQKISELLSSVTREQVTKYFKLRHNRQDEVWEEIYKKQPELRSHPIEYALDNTSISTYSNTLNEAQYGHAKCDPELKQINYTIICDQRSGDIVFAYMYDGAVNDISALSDILFAMQEYRIQTREKHSIYRSRLFQFDQCSKNDQLGNQIFARRSICRGFAQTAFC